VRKMNTRIAAFIRRNILLSTNSLPPDEPRLDEKQMS